LEDSIQKTGGEKVLLLVHRGEKVKMFTKENDEDDGV
jgi:hypothetical protein